MRTTSVIYVQNQNQTLMGNWKKYGKWCGIGDYIEGINPPQEASEMGLLGKQLKIQVNNLKKLGSTTFWYKENTCYKEEDKIIFYTAETRNLEFQSGPYYQLKWIANDKIPYYPLFNIDRAALNWAKNGKEFKASFYYINNVYTKHEVKTSDSCTKHYL